MTVKDYLQQAYRLDKRINSHIREKEELHQMACSVSAPQLKEDRVQTSRSNDAPFVRALEKMWALEEKINAEIDRLVDLKQQIREVIGNVDSPEEQLVLRCRYIHNMTWEQIGMEIYADERTARRCHDRAISHATMPENPIII